MAFKDPPDPLELATFRFSALRKVLLFILSFYNDKYGTVLQWRYSNLAAEKSRSAVEKMLAEAESKEKHGV
jgi:hypothetical protein